MKKILVPIDGSEFSMKAIDKAKELAKAFESEIVLLNVTVKSSGDYHSHPYKFSPDENKKRDVEQTERKTTSIDILEAGKARLSDMNTNVKIVILEGNVVEEILNYAEKNNIELVIIGSRGMTGIQSVLLGSVTRQVALKLTKPVLIMR